MATPALTYPPDVLDEDVIKTANGLLEELEKTNNKWKDASLTDQTKKTRLNSYTALAMAANDATFAMDNKQGNLTREQYNKFRFIDANVPYEKDVREHWKAAWTVHYEALDYAIDEHIRKMTKINDAYEAVQKEKNSGFVLQDAPKDSLLGTQDNPPAKFRDRDAKK